MGRILVRNPPAIATGSEFALTSSKPPDAAPNSNESTAEAVADAVTFGSVVRRLGPAGPLALVAATLPAIGGIALLFLLTWIEPYLTAAPVTGVMVYIIGFALLSGFAILPTYAQAVLGGWVYKFPLGLPPALAGILGGALIGYAIGKRAAADRVMQLISERPEWRAVHDTLLGSGFWRTLLIVSLLRLNSPFALTNFVLAATRTNIWAYALGTVIGLSPRTAAAVFIAAGLKVLTFEKVTNRWLWIGTIVTTIIVVVIIGQIANSAIARVTGQKDGEPASKGDR